MSKFLSKRLSSLIPYTPGEQPKNFDFIKLNTNESPFPPSPKAQAAAAEAAKRLELYPDPQCKLLTESVAASLGLSSDQVLMTNGSDEILYFSFLAFCDSSTPAVMADITYGFYKVYADLCGVEKTVIPLKEDFTIDVDAFCRAKGTIFIANPNAPTGLFLSLEQIERILSSDPHRIVLIDEAYVAFGGESAVKLIAKYDNLIVTRTFSKSHSMAGARLGFGAASKAVIGDLNTVKYSINPYNINSMTMSAGLGVMSDEEYTLANCNTVIENREYASRELRNLGFTVTNSVTNFIFCAHPTIGGEEINSKLREKGILVRHFKQERITNYNRITVGSLSQMKSLIKALEEIIEEKK